MQVRRCVLTLCFAVAAMLLHAQTREFPYPHVPDTLRGATHRGMFLLRHYWDNVDFSDTLQLKDADITEQGFVNYVDLIPRLAHVLAQDKQTGSTHDDIQQAVSNFVIKAFATPYSKTFFESLINHYLDDPNSPLRNDITYAMILEAELEAADRQAATVTADSLTAQTTAEKTRLDFKLRNVRKNQEGSVAADFAFVDRQGKSHRLSDYRNQPVVVYFYDPDCENCHRITAELSKSEVLRNVTVLAIYPDEDTENWRQKPQPFPDNWTDGYSPKGEVTGKGLYYIQATPSIYLLDEGNRIVLKDTSPDMLLGTIQQRIQL